MIFQSFVSDRVSINDRVFWTVYFHQWPFTLKLSRFDSGKASFLSHSVVISTDIYCSAQSGRLTEHHFLPKVTQGHIWSSKVNSIILWFKVFNLKISRSSRTCPSYFFVELPCWRSLVPALKKSYFWPENFKISIFKTIPIRSMTTCTTYNRVHYQVQNSTEARRDNLSESEIPWFRHFVWLMWQDYIIYVTWMACHMTFGLKWNILIER